MFIQKCLFGVLSLAIFTSCIEISGPENRKIIFDETVSTQSKTKSPYNSMYTERDVVGCLGAAVLAPAFVITEALIGSLLGKHEVDLYINEKAIKLVKKDVDKYLENNSSITPKDFWKTLSKESIEEISYLMIEKYGSISNETFIEKKKLLAYSFLFLFEQGKEKASYTFSYDHRDSPGVFTRESVSFASSKKISKAQDVGVCGYFRYSNIDSETDMEFIDPSITKLVKCSDGNNRLEFSENEYGVLSISTGDNQVQFDVVEVDITENKRHDTYKYDRWFEYPKLEANIYKSYYYENQERIYSDSDINSLNIKIEFDKNSKLSSTGMKCMNIK